jgi:DnaJ-class molecular chaperone
MWQKCPICNGRGVVEVPILASCDEKCPTCNGQRIISDITGLPPITTLNYNVDLNEKVQEMSNTYNLLNK